MYNMFTDVPGGEQWVYCQLFLFEKREQLRITDTIRRWRVKNRYRLRFAVTGDRNVSSRTGRAW